MRAYGPGRPDPQMGPPTYQDDEQYASSGQEEEAASSRSGSEQEEEETGSDATPDARGRRSYPAQQQQHSSHRQQQPQQQDPASFRPWTLPHVDARYGRRAGSAGTRAAAAESGMPTVVVHPHSDLPPMPEGGGDVWTIRPRAGSGRTSLGRRRRYDSYVSTLDSDTLDRLDEEILQSAVPEDEEDDEEERGPRAAGAYAVRASPRRQGQQRRRRRGAAGGEGEEDDDEEEEEDQDEARSTMSSPRRRERLCDESLGERSSPLRERAFRGQQHQQPGYRHSSPARRGGHHHHHAVREEGRDGGDDDEEEDEEDDGSRSQRSPRRPASEGARGSSDYQSPLRPRRESLSRGAPPPNPTFHDPKMGPPQTRREAPGDGRQRGSSHIPDSDGPTRLPCKRVGKAAGGGRGRASYEDEEAEDASAAAAYDEEAEFGVGPTASPSKGRRRDSGVLNLGVGWLYGEGDYDRGSGTGRRTLLHWLDERLPRMKEEERIARAAVYLSDAIDTRPVRVRGGGKPALFAYRLQKRSGWTRMMQALAVAHLLLALWEPPRALPDDASYHDSVSRHARTGAASTATHLLGVEMVLVLLFALDLALEIFALGANGFFGLNAPPRVLEGKGKAPAREAKFWGQARFALVVLFFADVCLSLDQHATSPRFSRPLRPLYLVCLSATLRRWAVLLVHLMAKLRDVALGTGIFLGLFSLLGLILFGETGYYAASPRYLNFDNFLNSAVALYVLMTTQNFGALLNPAYAADPGASTPLYFFFFMAFVLVVVLFLAHLALPRVYWVYQSFQRRQAYESRLLERLALLMAFRCLDPDRRGWVDLSSFRSMLRYARPDFFDLHTGYEKDCYCGATEHMFGQLARTHPGRIYAHEFLAVCEVVLTEFHPVVPTLEPGYTASEWHQRERARFRALFNSRYAEAASLALLVLSCFFLAFYGSPAVSKAALRGFAYAVILTFTAEVCLKMWAFGPKTFLKVPSNVVDALIIGASFCSLVAYSFSPPHSPMRRSEQMANLCLLFLSLRLVRLFPKCAIFHKFSSAFRVLPFFLSSFALCVLLAYAWAVLGMAVFARYADRVQAVAAGQAGQPPDMQGWASVDNFNCFWSASVTLFQVATTYDWYRIMYLWMDVSGSAWTSLYFIAFHLVANVVVFQLTAALFIDAFLAFHDKRWVEAGDEEQAMAHHQPQQQQQQQQQQQHKGLYGDDASAVAAAAAGGEEEDDAAAAAARDGVNPRWSHKSAASAPPAPGEDRLRQQQQQQQHQSPRRASSSSSPSRRRPPGGGLAHSDSYTASVI